MCGKVCAAARQVVHVTLNASQHCSSQEAREARWAGSNPCPGRFCHDAAGKDATQDFEEIGHSKSARDMLEKYLIGTYAVSMDLWALQEPLGRQARGSSSCSSSVRQWPARPGTAWVPAWHCAERLRWGSQHGVAAQAEAEGLVGISAAYASHLVPAHLPPVCGDV